jgi:hypothetical protein
MTTRSSGAALDRGERSEGLLVGDQREEDLRHEQAQRRPTLPSPRENDAVASRVFMRRELEQARGHSLEASIVAASAEASGVTATAEVSGVAASAEASGAASACSFCGAAGPAAGIKLPLPDGQM